MPMVFGQPDVPAADRPTYRLPMADRRTRPMFHMMVHPDHWYWDPSVKEWLPDLGRLVVSAGVAGVGLDQNNREDDSLARASYTKQGWVIIENGDPKLAGVLPEGRYRTKWAAMGHEKAYAYGYVWEGFEVVLGKPVWGEDRGLKVRVLRAIVAAKYVQPMTQAHKRIEINATRRRVQRLAERAVNQQAAEIHRSRLRAAEQLLEDLEADYRKGELAEPTAPTPLEPPAPTPPASSPPAGGKAKP